MYILGIETSCDETSVAIVENGQKVICNQVSSSSFIHKKTGGIVPEHAAREQIKSMLPLLTICDSLININKVDSVAATVGPGLVGSLLVGTETAKVLSLLFQKPLIAVNHLIGHIYANWLDDQKDEHYTPPNFPSLALVVSGGHTDLVLIKSHHSLTYIGGTRDDAAGEAFDKTARMLNLPYPGGPSISKKANDYFNSTNNSDSLKLDLFPRPMIKSNNYDFSFSGLKTAVFKEVQSLKNVKRISAEIQEAIVDTLVAKSVKAVNKYKPHSFLLSGGVAANKRLRKKLKLSLGKTFANPTFYVPPPNLCTDNAAMIAAAAFYRGTKVPWSNLIINPQLSINESN